jgi:hypothetical protein
LSPTRTQFKSIGRQERSESAVKRYQAVGPSLFGFPATTTLTPKRSMEPVQGWRPNMGE